MQYGQPGIKDATVQSGGGGGAGMCIRTGQVLGGVGVGWGWVGYLSLSDRWR